MDKNTRQYVNPLDKVAKSGEANHGTYELSYIAVGATDKEIAGKLRISPHAIETEIDKIFEKIKVSNRLEATLWAAKNL